MKRRRPCRVPALAAALLATLFLLSSCGIADVWHDTTEYLAGYFHSDDNLRKRVVVMPFTSKIPGLAARAHALGEILRKRVAASGSYTMDDPAKLQAAVKQVAPAVRNRQERMIMAARRLGLNTVVTGRLSDLSVAYDLTGIYGFRENTPFLRLEADLTVIDVASGTIMGIKSFVQRHKLDDVTAEAIKLGAKPKPKLVDKLQAKLVQPCLEWLQDTIGDQPWAGYIFEVKGKKAKVSVGRDTGLSLGDELTVYAHGERIMSGAGRLIYLPGPPVAKVRITKLMPRSAWAEILPLPPDEQPPPPPPPPAEEGKGKKAKGEKQAKKPETKKPAPPKVRPGMLLRAY